MTVQTYTDIAETERCRSLWCAVLLAAWNDAIGKPAGGGLSPAAARIAQRSAVAWFIDNRKDFRQVCWLAGFDADDIHAKAVKALDGLGILGKYRAMLAEAAA